MRLGLVYCMLTMLIGLVMVIMTTLAILPSPLTSIMTIKEYIVKKVSNKVTFEDALEIRSKLIKDTGMSYDIPPLLLNTSTAINAAVNSNMMYITVGMLNYAKNKDEVAYVISHEIAHVMLGHTNPLYNRIVLDSRINEANADKMAIFLMMKSGYNICNAKGIWERLRKDKGDMISSYSHPNLSVRIYQLQFPQCGG